MKRLTACVVVSLMMLIVAPVGCVSARHTDRYTVLYLQSMMPDHVRVGGIVRQDGRLLSRGSLYDPAAIGRDYGGWVNRGTLISSRGGATVITPLRLRNLRSLRVTLFADGEWREVVAPVVCRDDGITMALMILILDADKVAAGMFHDDEGRGNPGGPISRMVADIRSAVDARP